MFPFYKNGENTYNAIYKENNFHISTVKSTSWHLNEVSTSEQKVIENKVNENLKEFHYLECNLSHANNEGV
jgi:hypothetical protein